VSGSFQIFQLVAVRRIRCTEMRSFILVLILAAASAAADTELHRCLLEDGTIAFQEIP